VVVVMAVIVAIMAGGDGEDDPTGETQTPDSPVVIPTTEVGGDPAEPLDRPAAQPDVVAQPGFGAVVEDPVVPAYRPRGFLTVRANVAGAEIVVEDVIASVRRGETTCIFVGTARPCVRIEEDSTFSIMDGLVTVGDFMICVRESASPCRAAVDGGFRVADDAESCRLGGDDSSLAMNCVNHTAAEAYCESVDLRLPTSSEWDQASRSLELGSDLWQWTSTAADDGDKQVVRGGSADAGVDDLDRLSLAGAIRATATPDYTGIRCVGDLSSLTAEED
jgi:formylglycine-generating enzyme required for sulfatase activity